MVVHVPSGDDRRLTDQVVRLIGDLASAVTRERAPLTVARRPDPGGAHTVVVPALDDLLHHVRELWWQRLDPADRLAVHVAAIRRDPRPTPLDDVIRACRLAADCGQAVTVPEFTSMTCGSVKPGPRATWQAEVGTRPYGIGHIGAYGSIRAATAAVWDTVEAHREQLRESLRSTSELLSTVAAHGWEEPAVSVWATPAQRADDDPALVTAHQIAHRTRVRPADVDRWRATHATFPRPEAGTSVWYWPLVERWLAAAGLLPDPLPDDRPTFPGDRTF